MFAVGGTERQFVNVTKHLDRSRFDIRVGCLSREGDFLKDIEAMRVPVTEYRISSLYSPGTMHAQWRFAQDLRREGVRLVHAYGFYPNVFCIPPARIAGCITIASVRDTGVFTSRVKLKSVAQKMACRMADSVVANSVAVRDWLVGLGMNEDQIHVIPNGIVVPPLGEAPGDSPIRREFGIHPKAPVIAVVSRLNPGKGIEYFLHAVQTVIKRYRGAKFLIVGASYFNPQYKPSLEKLAQDLGLQDHVIFTGERNDVQQLLREANLVVLPSLSEGFSNVILEAMAAGLPVVATNVGGNPEIVRDGKTGLLVPARDAGALAQGMIRLLEAPDLARQYGKTGHERVSKHFSLASTIRSTEDLYMTLLEERKWLHAPKMTRSSRAHTG